MRKKNGYVDLKGQQKFLIQSKNDFRITNLAEFVCKRLSVKKGKVLDVGVGNGYLLSYFQKRGFETAGYEYDKELVALLNSKDDTRWLNIKEGDITKLSGNAQYDVVVCTDVIEHIKDDQKAVKNLYSFVKPGGILVIGVPAFQFLFGKRDVMWGHYRRYSKSRLLNKVHNLKGKVMFTSYWNMLGFFGYFFFEKILRRTIYDTYRKNNRPWSRLLRALFNLELKVEKIIGWVPFGLTLFVFFKKEK